MENKQKYVYMFSEEGAADYGYSTAKVTIDGKEQTIKYSAMYESEESSKVYIFKDKKMVGQFEHSQLRDIKEHDGKYSEIMRENRKLELPKAMLEVTEMQTPAFVHSGEKLLGEYFKKKGISEGFDDNNNNFIPKRESFEMPIIKHPEKLMEDQTGWKPPKQK